MLCDHFVDELSVFLGDGDNLDFERVGQIQSHFSFRSEMIHERYQDVEVGQEVLFEDALQGPPKHNYDNAVKKNSDCFYLSLSFGSFM